MIEFITQQLQNQFLSGGMVLMVMGAILAVSRKIPTQIFTLIKRRLITVVDVSDQDEAFYWIQAWLAQHPYSKKARLLTISTRSSEHRSEEVKEEGCPNETNTNTSRPEVFFSPAPGVHLFRFEGHWVLFTRERNESQGSTSWKGRYWRETFTIQTFVRDREFFRRLVYEARSIAFPEKDRRVNIYTPNYGNWTVASSRLPRHTSSVILEGNLMEDTIEEIKTFFESAKWYQDRGIPYQMGYLFHGPPGNGKTSLALALASKFQRSIYLAKVSGVSDGNFRALMAAVPQHSIVLIEDVDCFFEGRKHVQAENALEPSLTFSGFLNAIDGVTGSEGRLLIMTTNHPEKLDDALLRPGRIDRKIKLDNATPEQARRLFLRFFGDEELAMGFATEVESLSRTGAISAFNMAELQSVLLNNRDDGQMAIKSIRKLSRLVA